MDPDVEVFVATSATVEDGVELGRGTKVWADVVVRRDARVGEECVLGRGAFVDEGVVIGARCKIQNNALLYRPARLGEGVFIGPAVVLTNDRFPRAVNPDGTPKDAGDWEAEGVTIEEGASVGAAATVLGGVTIGRWALVASNATVTGDVAPFSLVAGTPARRIAWVGQAGRPLQRSAGGEWRCPVTGASFVERDHGLEER